MFWERSVLALAPKWPIQGRNRSRPEQRFNRVGKSVCFGDKRVTQTALRIWSRLLTVKSEHRWDASFLYRLLEDIFRLCGCSPAAHKVHNQRNYSDDEQDVYKPTRY